MACNIICTNCGENFGKDVENPKKFGCGNCGETVYNEYGDDEDDD